MNDPVKMTGDDFLRAMEDAARQFSGAMDGDCQSANDERDRAETVSHLVNSLTRMMALLSLSRAFLDDLDGSSSDLREFVEEAQEAAGAWATLVLDGAPEDFEGAFKAALKGRS